MAPMAAIKFIVKRQDVEPHGVASPPATDNTMLIVGIVLTVVAVAMFCGLWACWHKKKKKALEKSKASSARRATHHRHHDRSSSRPHSSSPKGSSKDRKERTKATRPFPVKPSGNHVMRSVEDKGRSDKSGSPKRDPKPANAPKEAGPYDQSGDDFVETGHTAPAPIPVVHAQILTSPEKGEYKFGADDREVRRKPRFDPTSIERQVVDDEPTAIRMSLDSDDDEGEEETEVDYEAEMAALRQITLPEIPRVASLEGEDRKGKKAARE
ncbi:uncharacterized protein JN550_000020 [Neoarthrinium moseri]|uniref:uncharacterized protein n=1 Tax=Neoarthrinium moseri TaxID=1658444 RepID=UPI001FDDE096|nr:uncharacterized protein JN550_000020 [Neoarthrinium moseri]KAI1877838.1 hypothetical protein JN550_000020 [Neoarthrinium moseri]